MQGDGIQSLRDQSRWKPVHRIRSLEPTGLLKIAEAQIHQKQTDATFDQLEETKWPPRFSNVHQECDAYAVYWRIVPVNELNTEFSCRPNCSWRGETCGRSD
jgi:hypothetical protein